MKKNNTRDYLFVSKLIYTIIIVFIYAFMRKVNLYGVDIEEISKESIDAGMFYSQIVGGDLFRCSIMAVGFAPYMIANIITMIIQLVTPSEIRGRISLKRVNLYTLFLTVLIATIQAIIRCNELVYIYLGVELLVARIISVLEMILGSILTVWLAVRNKKYGLGGQLALILINIFDNILNVAKGVEFRELLSPLLLGIVMMIIMLFMENAEKRIPMQRISIHNIHANKNYQAIKFNPVGIMPAIFASAAVMLPQTIAKTILMNRPDSVNAKWFVENLELTKDYGVMVYVLFIYILNFLFVCIMLNPKELSESLQKSGDSIENLRPGKETRRYLRRNIVFRCLVSATVVGACLGGSLLYQIHSGTYTNMTIAMLPSSIMMFSGLGSTLYREAEAIINTDSYKAFI